VRPHDLDTLEFPRVLDTIAAFARSDAGREAVRALRPVPASDAEGTAAAVRRLDTTDELMAAAAEWGRLPIGDLPALAPVLAAAMPHGAVLEPRHLLDLRALLATATAAGSYLLRDAARFPALAAWGAELPDTSALAGALASTLDDTGQVRDDASPALAAARRVTRELRVTMEARLERLLRDPQMAEVVAEDYVTIRNGRFVVPIRIHALHAVPGVVQDRSQTGETIFLEPLFAVELNNRLLLARKDEEAEERRVRGELTALAREHAGPLGAVERTLAAVDALAAAAAFAERHACTRPEVVAAGVSLPAARHPLLAASGRPVVPVDILLPAERRGLAITGPNAGGKTVALKTLGLAAVMAHTGLFVPAAEPCRVPALEAILVDIGDEQSIDRDLSTFSAHVESLAGIARLARPGALVLLDEPGAGTDPIEGSALAVGLLTDLLERGPLVVFTSHFAQVKTFALAESALEVAAFDVDPETGAPRFRLSYHTVGQSLALPIARRHGLPARALAVAEQVLAGESRDLAEAISRLERSRAHLDQARGALAAERERLVAEREEAARLTDELRARKRKRWSEDLEESARWLRDLDARGRALLDELRQKPEPATLRRFVREVRDDVAARTAALAPEEAPGRRPPAPGDTVEVAGRGIRGELIEIEGERARIQRGGMRFEVPAAQLRVVGAAAPRERVAVQVERPEDATTELMLVGRRVRDAVAELEAFLDRAARAGLSEVRVVHGLGTGALRRALHEALAASPYCATFREAEPAAGGAGVTVVELA
jgi:DNA mismatch repair protein MutS2